MKRLDLIRHLERHGCALLCEGGNHTNPKIKGLIKLNKNENPYSPSPRVLAAIPGGSLFPASSAQHQLRPRAACNCGSPLSGGWDTRTPER